jgi:ABC-type antimicrobial peptide transport system permease subunit
MQLRRHLQTTDLASIFKKSAYAAFSLAALFSPALAYARQTPIDVDTITTGSIASQAMIWKVDPSIILILLIAAFLVLVVSGFALIRRSLREAAQPKRTRPYRSFE